MITPQKAREELERLKNQSAQPKTWREMTHKRIMELELYLEKCG
jgi:hypothetical protein